MPASASSGARFLAENQGQNRENGVERTSAIALTRAGAERKTAYEAVQRAAMKTWQGKKSFAENAKAARHRIGTEGEVAHLVMVGVRQLPGAEKRVDGVARRRPARRRRILRQRAAAKALRQGTRNDPHNSFHGSLGY